jgi:glutaredoxin-like protein NrdH
MSVEELIDTLATEVEGNNNEHDITIFTLSTCMWCKKCKRWLKEHDVTYRYVDVDKIQYSQKSQIIDYLREKYDNRISYPYMVLEGGEKTIVGYSPNKYEEALGKGGE